HYTKEGLLLKLEKIIIENFRGYRERIEVKLDNLTAFIGKNDVGKSTILEALEVFFNNESVKIEPNDACVYGSNQKVRIGCVFSQIPHTSIIIDSSAETSLKQEYLLNEHGLLEIHKIFDCSKKKPSEEVFAVAEQFEYEGDNLLGLKQKNRSNKNGHQKIKKIFDCSKKKPSEEVFAVAEQFEYKGDNLLGLTQSKLKKEIKEYEIPSENVSLNSNVSMRQAIYQHMYSQNFPLVTHEIQLNSNDAKSVWEKIKGYLPIYSLFQADRPSSDGDSEVQNPMRLAVQEALDSQQEKLSEIQKKVEAYALDVARHTVDKIKEMDADLASQLLPRFVEDPKWPNIFKLTLDGDNDIPINKRGSGVRRLILLNFFRAEVERKRNIDNDKGIIYAIEEPETAQHPDNQKMLADTFKILSEESESQVLLTTHVPGFAGILPKNSVRYIKNLPEKLIVSYEEQKGILKDVTEALGILPSFDLNRVKALVFVEGMHDVEALKSLSNIVCQYRDDLINLSDTDEIIVLP